ncbi:MAG: 50S ribosomal protein L3 [Candidatus Cloacimonetes bacterium]|nr:50S ribosomal protein L3 [Candidatus Cloacimonadota bacterium]
MVGLIGEKLGMTQLFDQDGRLYPVTVIKAGPCHVIQRKTVEKDGYDAVQLGFMQCDKKKINKPLTGHFDKHDSEAYKVIKEFRLHQYKNIEQGEELNIDMFRENELITIHGISKGKGYAGVMKRHGFRGFKATHGVHESYRGPGSIGQCATPGHVAKGRKLPGHKGVERVTVKNMKIIKVDLEKNLIFINGAVPGHRHSIVLLKKAQF